MHASIFGANDGCLLNWWDSGVDCLATQKVLFSVAAERLSRAQFHFASGNLFFNSWIPSVCADYNIFYPSRTFFMLNITNSFTKYLKRFVFLMFSLFKSIQIMYIIKIYKVCFKENRAQLLLLQYGNSSFRPITF